MPITPTILKAPGNGDCLYHSVMLNIIHGALSGSIKDNSRTGQSIKAHLIPAITRELQLRGRSINLSDKTLKDAILALLEAAPIDPMKSVKKGAGIHNFINHCDLYHLLRDICGPALRKVMQEGANRYHHEFAEQAKNIIFMEFRNFLIYQYGNILGYSDDARIAAKNYLSSSEFHDLPKANSAAIHREWNALTRQARQKDEPNDAYIVKLFNRWWTPYQVELYKNMHKKPGTMAGRPQIAVLGMQLQCQLSYLDSKTNTETLHSPAIENANTFYFQGGNLHYDAVVEADPISQRLKSRMDRFNTRQETLKDTVYNWAKNTDEEMIAEDIFSEDKPLAIIPVPEIMKATISSIEHYETGKIAPESKPNTSSLEIIQAAKLGYQGALKATTFGKHLKSLDQIDLDQLKDEAKAEAEYFLYLIEEQNQEITRFLQGQRG